MSENKPVVINSRKFDGTIHKSWSCELINETPDYYLFLGIFQSEIKHPHLGVIRPGTASYEYYWKRECYNVFRFVEPEGVFRNFYCNINLPPTFSGNVLDYIDLDIDVLVWKDFSCQILDRDEFESNAAKYQYPSETRIEAKKSLRELLRLIENRQFPFDIKI